MASFQKNEGTLGKAGVKRLADSCAFLVGLGGLGGFVANGLVRLGVKKIHLVDCDVYEESNLNRQLFSSQMSLGKKKTDQVKKELSLVNPHAEIITHDMRIEEMAAEDFPKEADIIIDALDDITTKIHLEAFAGKVGKPLLHGAIGGWYGQVGIISPGKGLLRELYGEKKAGVEKEMENPTFTPAVIANLMVTEYAKYITKNDHVLMDRILYVDLEEQSYHILFGND